MTPDIGGAVTPVANNINVFGKSTINDVDNGIQTQNGGAGELDIFLTNRIVVTTTTIGAVTSTVPVMTPTNGTSLTFRMFLTAYDAANNEAIGGEQIGLARKAAGVVVVVGTNDTFDENDAALGANDWEIQASGGNLVLAVLGIAGRTIDWKAVFQYTQVS